MTDADLLNDFFNALVNVYGVPIIKSETKQTCLEHLYSMLPAKFPPLYEKLLLSYRWQEIDLGILRLLESPEEQDFTGITDAIFRDTALSESLIPAGFIQFAKGPDLDYDPICFDIKSRQKDGDCRLVKIDHEGILCFSKIIIIKEVAPSFRSFVKSCVSSGNQP